MDYKDKPRQGLCQRNLITAFKRSRVAQSCVTLVLFIAAVIFLMSWKNSLDAQDQALAARRRINAKFSADDFLKYQGGDVKLPADNRGLVRYITNQIAGPSRQKLNLTESKRMDYSAAGQSKFVDNLLGGRMDGFYVECGAANGERYSNSLFFEKERGWDGFLIEANPWSYRKLLLKRRSAYSINACLNPSNQAKVMTFKPYGLVGGLEQRMDKRQIEAIHKHPEYNRDIEVQCYPFYSIMLALGPTHIDYFALDIHGAELDVLKTIPFDQVTIDVISVEYRITRDDKSTDVKASLAKLAKIRSFFESTKIYEEKGILPSKAGQVKKDVEANGLDIIFMRKAAVTEFEESFEEGDIE